MNAENDHSVGAMWDELVQENADFKMRAMPDSWYFCDNEKDANECSQLVVQGIKRATCSSLWWHEENKEDLPKVGGVNIITNWKGNAKAIIKTTKVERVAFNEITQAHAEKEGEGDKSLSYWKRVHWDYFTREMKPYGTKPTEDMILIYEHFETIWT